MASKGAAAHTTIDDFVVPVIPNQDLEIRRCVGRGGFGRVHEAEWRGRRVAVKYLLSRPTDIALLPEVRLLATLRHRNIIRLYGVTKETDPEFGIITEFAPDGSLFDRLHSVGASPLSIENILDYSSQIVAGMAYLHDEAPTPIIHRDLKSNNVLFFPGNLLKICDFGTARQFDQPTFMTMVGTFAWMAPEIMRGEAKATPKCDVYSFGVVLWEMLTRSIPFEGIEALRVLWLVVNNGERLPIPTATPPLLANLIKACWTEDPSTRPYFSNIRQALQDYALSCHGQLKAQTMDFYCQELKWAAEIQDTYKRLQSVECNLTSREAQLKQREATLTKMESDLRNQEWEVRMMLARLRSKDEADQRVAAKLLAAAEHKGIPIAVPPLTPNLAPGQGGYQSYAQGETFDNWETASPPAAGSSLLTPGPATAPTRTPSTLHSPIILSGRAPMNLYSPMANSINTNTNTNTNTNVNANMYTNTCVNANANANINASATSNSFATQSAYFTATGQPMVSREHPVRSQSQPVVVTINPTSVGFSCPLLTSEPIKIDRLEKHTRTLSQPQTQIQARSGSEELKSSDPSFDPAAAANGAQGIPSAPQNRNPQSVFSWESKRKLDSAPPSCLSPKPNTTFSPPKTQGQERKTGQFLPEKPKPREPNPESSGESGSSSLEEPFFGEHEGDVLSQGVGGKSVAGLDIPREIYFGNTYRPTENKSCPHAFALYVSDRPGKPAGCRIVERCDIHLHSSFSPSRCQLFDALMLTLERRCYFGFTVRATLHFRRGLGLQPIEIEHPLCLSDDGGFTTIPLTQNQPKKQYLPGGSDAGSESDDEWLYVDYGDSYSDSRQSISVQHLRKSSN